VRVRRLTVFPKACVCAIGLCSLAGCSNPVREAPALHHRHEVALAWGADKTTDGFHFPIACPGPGKLVLVRKIKFQLTCDEAEKIQATMVGVASDEPEGDEAASAANKRPSLECSLAVVPNYAGIARVLDGLRNAVEAGRSGPLHCALIRYD